MLRENIVVLENLEQLAQEALVAVHPVLLDGDYREVLLAGDTGDDMLACGRVGSRHDEGACVLRSVGVLDIDRNVRASHREDSVLVEHACAHVGKLAQLGICDNADSLGVLDDTGVSYQEAAYVCPVLVEVYLCSLCNYRTCEVRTAA